MRLGVTISSFGHALLLAWALVSFSAKPFDAMQIEAMPVDVVSDKDLAQMTAGVKSAPKAEAPKPLVEKVAPEVKMPEEIIPKVSDKQEIKSASAEKTPPVPDTKPKPEQKPVEKRDEIAETLKKEPPKPLPPKKPPQPKLDLSSIQNKLALLDKREQRRNAATGETLNPTASAGSSTGHASILSANYLNALVGRLTDCWNADGGNMREDVDSLYMTLSFNPDGTLAGEPRFDVPPRDSRQQAVAMGVLRAIIKCQPYAMLPRTRYDEWKNLAFKFCPIPAGEGNCRS
jgi:outer membrane biosynthesis protein TonB